MEGEENKLFSPNKKPMKFSIIQEKMLTIKCKQIEKQIKNNGGHIMDLNCKDNDCIMLAHKSYESCRTKNIFNIKYINKCISENKLLNLKDYQISRSTSPFAGCNLSSEIFEGKKCIHYKSSEEILRMIKEM